MESKEPENTPLSPGWKSLAAGFLMGLVFTTLNTLLRQKEPWFSSESREPLAARDPRDASPAFGPERGPASAPSPTPSRRPR